MSSHNYKELDTTSVLDSSGRGHKSWLAGRPTAFWVGIVIFVLCLAFNLKSGGIFLSADSLEALALDGAVGILLASGMTFLLAAGQLDLSLGANLVLSSVAAAMVIKSIAPIGAEQPSDSRAVTASLLGVVAAVLCGAVFGLLNGLIVTKMHVNSFIATLGTALAASGLVLVVTNGSNVSGMPELLQSTIGTSSLFGVIPYQTVVVALVVGGLWFLMRCSRLGLHSVAIGSSYAASSRSGMNITSTVVRLFVLMGTLGGLAGFLTLSRFSTTVIGGSRDAALAAIAAAVIGGTSLFGGVATVGGSVVGALLPVVLAAGLIVIGVPSFYQQIVVGLILILAVYVDNRRRSRREANR